MSTASCAESELAQLAELDDDLEMTEVLPPRQSIPSIPGAKTSEMLAPCAFTYIMLTHAGTSPDERFAEQEHRELVERA